MEIVECYYPVTQTKQSQLGNIKIKLTSSFPAANYMLKFSNRNTR